jgi:hypothetical protein
MNPNPKIKKSIKVSLFLMALALCIIGFWRFFPSKRPNLGNLQKESASPRKSIGKDEVATNEEGDVRSTGIFDQSAGSSTSQNVHLEVCVIDAQNRQEVRSGRINISREPIETVILTGDLSQNGCAGFALNPGRYQLHYQIPGFYGGRGSDALEIESNSDNVRKIVELYRSVTIKGIVKNAAHQPQPDASVIYGKAVSSSSFLFGTKIATDNLGEFSIDMPSNQTSVKVYASKPPHGIAQIGPFDASEAGNRYFEIVLPKEQRTATISGQIFDSGMKPISGASVLFQPMPSFNQSDPVLSTVTNFFQTLVKSNNTGYYSLPVLPMSKGTFHVMASGSEPYREQFLNGIAEDIQKNIQLKTPEVFSVRVIDSSGNTLDGLDIKAENSSTGRLSPDSNKYYVTQYPANIYADGIGHNLGITQKKSIENNKREVLLSLGNCEIQGEVVDEDKRPIKNITVTVDSIGGTENDPGLRLSEYVQFYSESGKFTLRNLIPGACSITIAGFSNVQETFERKTLAINLEKGMTAKPIIVLARK